MKVNIIQIGKFASDISKQLNGEQWNVTVTEVNEDYSIPNIDNMIQTAETHILISHHPCVSFCKSINDLCYKYKKTFVPIIIDQPYLTIGPIFKAQGDSCYFCYLDRYMQHAANPDITQSVFDYYDRRVRNGPNGYHYSDVLFVSNLIFANLESSFEQFRGKLLRVNLINREIVVSEVIGVHGCPRCGLNRDEKTRSYKDLHNYLIKLNMEREIAVE